MRVHCCRIIILIFLPFSFRITHCILFQVTSKANLFFSNGFTCHHGHIYQNHEMLALLMLTFCIIFLYYLIKFFGVAVINVLIILLSLSSFKKPIICWFFLLVMVVFIFFDHNSMFHTIFQHYKNHFNKNVFINSMRRPVSMYKR